MTSYEELLNLIHELPRSENNELRHLVSCGAVGVLKLAKTPQGRIEIFIESDPLASNLHRVRDALEYQNWYRLDQSNFSANRILLPAAGHFEQVAAFLCTELLRNGVDEDPIRAFAETEPLIDLAISDLLMADESLIGLLGEMFLLRALLRRVSDDRVPVVLESWKGFRDSARDFQFVGIGVEVKTTTSSTSSHLLTGIHQIEVGHGVDGIEEWNLVLASIGIEIPGAEDQANTTCLPEIVDDILEIIQEKWSTGADSVSNSFLGFLNLYGARSRLGYDHRLMNQSSRFLRRVRLRFARAYDLSDQAIRLINSEDLQKRPFIEANSISFRVNFPEKVSGDINPVVGLSNISSSILNSSIW